MGTTAYTPMAVAVPVAAAAVPVAGIQQPAKVADSPETIGAFKHGRIAVFVQLLIIFILLILGLATYGGNCSACSACGGENGKNPCAQEGKGACAKCPNDDAAKQACGIPSDKCTCGQKCGGCSGGQFIGPVIYIGFCVLLPLCFIKGWQSKSKNMLYGSVFCQLYGGCCCCLLLLTTVGGLTRQPKEGCEAQNGGGGAVSILIALVCLILCSFNIVKTMALTKALQPNIAMPGAQPVGAAVAVAVPAQPVAAVAVAKPVSGGT